MDQSLQNQIETYLSHLDSLIRRGRELRDMLVANPTTCLRLQPLASGRKIAE